jgi:ADP-heptose:LPS heptosyltransferase
MMKSLELAIRGVFNRRIGSGGQPVVVSSPTRALALPERPSIVLLRQDRIGDVLITVPFVRALRNALPQAVITVVLGTNNAAVANALAPWIDGTVVYRKSVRGMITTRRYLRALKADVVVDMMDNPSATSAMLMRATQARYRIGIDKLNRGVYTHVVPLLDRATVHIVDRICQLALPFGIDIPMNERRLEYRLTQADHQQANHLLGRSDAMRPLFFVNISGSSEERMYGVERTARALELASDVLAAFDVRICGAPQHASLVEEVRQRTGFPSIPPVTSFHAFAAVIAQASFLVTPDTSAVHVAAAFNVPSVVLYKQHDPTLCVWSPYQTRHEAVIDTHAIANINPELVAQAIRQLVCGPAHD